MSVKRPKGETWKGVYDTSISRNFVDYLMTVVSKSHLPWKINVKSVIFFSDIENKNCSREEILQK